MSLTSEKLIAIYTIYIVKSSIITIIHIIIKKIFESFDLKKCSIEEKEIELQSELVVIKDITV